MFEGQPKGLYTLALANTGERFGYYTMLAVFLLFLQDNFGWTVGLSGTVYSSFLMLVYFLPIVGGAIADRIGFNKCVTVGIFVMFFGYVLLALPAGSSTVGVAVMAGALVMISVGTSLFKGNLQVMIGNMYDAPQYAAKRDEGFSIFYMAINIGAMFAPTAAIEIMKWSQATFGITKAESYHFAFGVACASLILSLLIYFLGKSTYRNALTQQKNKESGNGAANEEMSPQDTKDRIVALCLVFAVVVFFWMAFHQNGSTLTQFARDLTAQQSMGVETMMFDVTNLVACIFIVYALFALFQSKTAQGKGIAGVVLLVAVGWLGYQYTNIPADGIVIEAPIFQQFNACFVVGLTPVFMAIFAWLAKRGKEPSAPRKIGYGMLVAGMGYVIMMVASIGLTYSGGQRVSPNWLVSTYFVLTLAELLLSPMGISFVSKVAPPKYKGLMMGCWFGATAIGNMLVSIPALLWGNVPLVAVWGVLVALCVLSFLFIFSVMKKLEKVC